MSPARLAARCSDLLGPVAGPVLLHAPAAAGLAAALATHVRPARAGETPVAAVVAFLGSPVHERQRLLAVVHTALGPGAPLVVVDHNQPRVWWRRLGGVAMLARRGFGPARGRYPAARELAALGFAVERLRLADGERVQLVLARRL